MKKNYLSFILFALFFLMLSASRTAFAGAKNGLDLWLFTVVPSLLPYLIISTYLTESGSFRFFSHAAAPLTTRLFHLSPDCGYVILLGFFCGYPMGSKLCADLIKKGSISRREGQLLLSFCNNVSPAFLTTYLCGHVIGIPEKKGAILLILILLPLLYGMVLCRIFAKEPAKSSPDLPRKEEERLSFDRCILSGFEKCFQLGGYIILFSIINQFFLSFPFSSDLLRFRLCALTEITSGLHTYVSCSPDIRLSETVPLTAFGGLNFAISAFMCRPICMPIKMNDQ